MAATEGALHVDAEFQKVFDFVKHVFNIDEFYHDQTQLINAFVFQSLPWIYDMINEQSI